MRVMNFVCILFLASCAAASFDNIELIANIETIGIIVSGDSLPNAATLEYRSGSGNWRTGHPLCKIGVDSLAGSLFDLAENTPYEVRVSNGSYQISGVTTTQVESLVFVPTTTIYVDAAAAPGGDGSQAAPFQRIQDGLDDAVAGSRVLVADGVYHETAEFVRSGSTGNWIQLIAAGSGAVLDGSQQLSGNVWTLHDGSNGIWRTNIGSSIAYLARDTLRYYAFDSMAGLLAGLGHEGVPMAEGWYIAPTDSIMYVRSFDNPNLHDWHVPRLNEGVTVYEKEWVWIEGFEVRYYGESWGNGLYIIDASNVVVRNNVIHHNTNGIFIHWHDGAPSCDNNRVEFNEVYDSPVDLWPWDAVKSTSMEGAGIYLSGRKQTIARGNRVHQIFNGIYTGRWDDRENPEISLDCDVYDNVVYHIGDDAFEPEGTCINNRFRDNIVDSALVGMSLAPITLGPAWVLRSQCTKFFGTAIKFSSSSDGPVYIYHNTSWTDFPQQNSVDFSGPADNMIMRNNVFRGTRYSIEVTFTGNVGHDWDYDNWKTTRGANEPHFKWENVRYNTIEDLCAATGLECHGFEHEPGLVNPQLGDVHLQANSANIDAGIFIPGINDNFSGIAPDLGVYEFLTDTLAAVENLTVHVSGNDVTLRWTYPQNGVEFLVYSTDDIAVPQQTLETVVTTTIATLLDEVSAGQRKEYFMVVVRTLE